MRIIGAALYAFHLSKTLSCSATSCRYSSLTSLNFHHPLSIRLLRSGKSNVINRGDAIGAFTTNTQSSSYGRKNGPQKPTKNIRNILPVAVISANSHDPKALKILLISFFEGEEDSVQKTITTITLICKNAKQIQVFRDNLSKLISTTSKSINPKTDELSAWEKAYALSDVSLVHEVAKRETNRLKMYFDSFDVLSYNDSKNNIFTRVPHNILEKFQQMSITSMKLAFEKDMANKNAAITKRSIRRDLYQHGAMKNLSNPTISMETSLEMESHKAPTKIVPLNFNALVQDTVGVDASKISPEVLCKLKTLDFNDNSAKICGKTLLKGFPINCLRMSYSTQSCTRIGGFSCGGCNYSYINPLNVTMTETEKTSCLSNGNTVNYNSPLYGLEPKRSASSNGLTSGTGDTGSRVLNGWSLGALMDCDVYKHAIKEADRLRAELKKSSEKIESCKKKSKLPEDKKAKSKTLDSSTCNLSKSRSSKVDKFGNGKKAISLKTEKNKNDILKSKKREASCPEKTKMDDKKEGPCKTKNKSDSLELENTKEKQSGSSKSKKNDHSCTPQKKNSSKSKEKKVDPCNPQEKKDPINLKKQDDPCKSKKKKNDPCKPKKKDDPCKSKKKEYPCISKQKKPDPNKGKQKGDPCKTKKVNEDHSKSKKKDMKDKCNPPEKKPHKSSKCRTKDPCKDMKEKENLKCSGKGSKSKSNMNPCTSKSKPEKSDAKSEFAPKKADWKSRGAPKKWDSRPKCVSNKTDTKSKMSSESKSICSKGGKEHSRKPKCNDSEDGNYKCNPCRNGEEDYKCKPCKDEKDGDEDYKCNPCKKGDEDNKCDPCNVDKGDKFKKCFSTSTIRDYLSLSKRSYSSTVFTLLPFLNGRFSEPASKCSMKSFSSTKNKDNIKKKEPNASCKLQSKPKGRKDIKKRTKPKNCYDEASEDCFKLCKEPNCTDGKEVDPKSKGKGKWSNKENEIRNLCTFASAAKLYTPRCRFFTSATNQKENHGLSECDETLQKKFKNEILTITDACQVERMSESVPNFSDYDVLIRTGAVAISGTDIHVYETGGYACPDMTLGHDAAGTVEKVGKCVQCLKPGDRVAMESGLSCGICDFCKRGAYNMCSQMLYNGFFTKYQAHPADLCHKLPDCVSMEEGSLVQALALGCEACFKGRITPTTNVAVIGTSATAISAALCARSIGAQRVCLVDSRIHSLEAVCQQFQFSCIPYQVNENACDTTKNICSVLGNWPDVIINCAITEATLNLGIIALQLCGTLVLAECEAECARFNVMDVIMKNLKIVSSFRSTHMFPTALHLIASGQAPMCELISKTYPWSKVEEAFQEALYEGNSSSRKVIVKCAEEFKE